MKATIIGDVHGCYDELCHLIEKFKIDLQDPNTIFVGDLIHKGPKSREVLDLVMSSKARVVVGNHERKFCQYVRGKFGPHEGFKALSKEFGKKLDTYIGWIEELPLYIEEEHFIVVHAGLHPEKALHKSNADVLTEIRTWDGKGKNLDNPEDPAWYDLYKGEKLVVFGHWARLGLMVSDSAICLDSGCVYGKELSALRLPKREIISVSATKAYVSLAG